MKRRLGSGSGEVGGMARCAATTEHLMNTPGRNGDRWQRLGRALALRAARNKSSPGYKGRGEQSPNGLKSEQLANPEQL